jgi:hypothetical protein
MQSYQTGIILHTNEIITTFQSAVIINIILNYNFTASIDEDIVLL